MRSAHEKAYDFYHCYHFIILIHNGNASNDDAFHSKINQFKQCEVFQMILLFLISKYCQLQKHIANTQNSV